MIDLEYLRELIRTVEESGIDSLELNRGGTRIRIAKTPAGAGPAPPSASAAPPAPAATTSTHTPAKEPAPEPEEPPAPGRGEKLVEVKSPMVGTFYRSSSPEAPPYVEVGGSVSKGQTLCILEAMKLMNELEAEIDGTVREICIENAEPVEYGEVLFRLEPAA
ncbi:MAG: acetyl-CoA carboxylase biotin carboxyl carrier protein [Longimicrobiaceae bacterium]